MQLRSRQLVCALVLAGAALTAPACGGSPGSSPSPPASDPSGAANPSGFAAPSGSAVPSPSESGDPPVSRILTWLRIGPNGEGTPLWYDPLKDGDCGDEQLLASRGQPIPRAGALLCEAATTNDPELWRQGEEALATTPAPGSCWEEETVAGLQRLVEFHRRAPEAVPELRVPDGTACPLVLESLVSPLAPGLEGLEISVSTCGGAPVFLQGNLEWMPPEGIRAVTVGATEVPVQQGNGSLFFRAPPSDVTGHVPVSVTDADWPVGGLAHLVYEVPATACPDPPPVPAPTPAPTAPPTP
ncbi:hypothetical protein CRM73_03905 [Kocuria sp. CCUG 69068]|uniref:hypothetical protein n=1 Tax=Kocuria TaxID=57493 RepID=UPI00159357A0|nr:hypothetical protein [Kocuria salina]MCC5782093.1 hypothetical protein [Kocuria sp. CCUG 69068]NVC24229.1 hypothetical protein [Kocuria salina]